MTTEEVMDMTESMMRLRSTFALFEMRRILREHGSTAAHSRRAEAIADELRCQDALP